jgi:hypothetical protein
MRRAPANSLLTARKALVDGASASALVPLLSERESPARSAIIDILAVLLYSTRRALMCPLCVSFSIAALAALGATRLPRMLIVMPSMQGRAKNISVDQRDGSCALVSLPQHRSDIGAGAWQGVSSPCRAAGQQQRWASFLGDCVR